MIRAWANVVRPRAITTRIAFSTHISCRSINTTSPETTLSPPKTPPRPPKRSRNPPPPGKTGDVWTLLSDLAIVNGGPGVVRTPDELWKKRSSQTVEKLEKLAHPAGIYAGRSVAVEKGNIARAYGQLSYILRTNNVRGELKLTERHEKATDKRRRLKSERHRRRFAEFIRNKVKVVRTIKARGA